MTEGRRFEDQVTMQTRVAVLERTVELQQKASDAQTQAISKSIDAFSAKLDTLTALMTSVTADAQASPMGRQLTADIVELQRTVGEHERFVQETNGALRLARFAFGLAGLSVVGQVVLWLATLGAGA